MHERHFAVVVIGGGPAGASAGYTLATNGIETCIIDKHHFPRDKLCGGLLTLRTKNIFDRIFAADWNRILHGTAHGVNLFRRNVLLAKMKSSSSIFFTQRIEYDAFLIDLASSSGANLVSGSAVKQIDLHRQRIILADGSRISYDILVGADGVNSLVGRVLCGRSFYKNRIGFALETEVARGDFDDSSLIPEIHLGAARWGYAWVFPKRDSVTIGIGGLHKYNKNLMEKFYEFIILRLRHLPEMRIRGHFVPFGDFRKSPGRGNVLLCGDAAGLVDSMTGEGIAFAMESGHAAAIAVIEHLHHRRNVSPYELYLSRYRKISAVIRLSNRYRNFVYPRFSEMALSKFLPHCRTLQEGYLNILADKIEYSHLPVLFRRQLYFGLQKLID
jgi:geranylgeranyl reductase family protein